MEKWVVYITQQTIQELFNNYLTKQPIFSNKKTLTSSYTPETVPHRDKQINQLGRILLPALKSERPSNVFIYGSTGTGKTLTTKYVLDELVKTATQNNNIIKTIYVNCKMKKVADTEYRFLAYLAEKLGETVPSTGLPTDQVYKIFFKSLDKLEGVVILIVDEIDALVNKVGDDFLYNLTRINQDLANVDLSVIGISNNLSFTDYLDARVKSSLSEEELIFPPYNAVQLQEILQKRAEIAFTNGKINDGVTQKCAALAAQEHGDARRALDLLRVAGEVAEREGDEEVSIKHVDKAEEKVDTDRIIEVVKTQPKQSKAIIYALLTKLTKENEKTLTGDVFNNYITICKKAVLKPLTQRRVSDILSELDMLGIINAKVISNGRYGRTREISLAFSEDIHKKIMDFFKNEFYF
ncbi:MAG: ORC1-type DNA replication protein [Candidatus Aenigmarchaeota archaeon]|nr:ORC1-type DNA replication protein [Candidatus Aenigmarchaeota archaeon]